MTDGPPARSHANADRAGRFTVAAWLLVPLTLASIPLFTFHLAGNLQGDTANQFMPFKVLAARAVAAGELPLWNPYAFSGMPLWADLENGYMHPTQLLFFLLPIQLAFPLATFLNLVLLVIGTYLLLRPHCHPLAAVAAAVAFGLSDPILHRVADGHLPRLQALVCLPWVLLCVERFRLTRRRSWMLGAGAALALQAVGGFPTTSLYTGVALLGYLVANLVSCWRSDRRRMGHVLSGWVLLGGSAGTLAAAQLLPTAELIARCGRARPGYAFVSEHSLPPINLVTMLVPDLFGSSTTRTAIQGGLSAECVLYIGVLPLLITLLLASQLPLRRLGQARRYLLFALAFLVLSFGTHNPLYRWVFEYVPGFGQVTDPGRMTAFSAFFLALCAGVGLEHWSTALPATSVRFRSTVRAVLLVVVTVLVVALVTVTFAQDWLSAYAGPRIAQRYGSLAAQKLAKLPVLYHTQQLALGRAVIVLCVSAVLLFLRVQGRVSARAFMQLSLLIIVADLLPSALRFTRNMSVVTTVETPAYARFFATEREPYRVLPLEAMRFNNLGSRFSIPTITGYNSINLADYQRLVGVIRGQPVDPVDRVGEVSRFDSPLLAMLNVRYILSYEPLIDARLEPVHASDVFVYRLRHAAATPAFFITDVDFVSSVDAAVEQLSRPGFDPSRRAVIEGPPLPLPFADGAGVGVAPRISPRAYGLNHLSLETETPEPGWLVLSEIFYPGWKAYIDADEVPVRRANVVLRAVPLPAGPHVVRLVYDPWTFRAGVWISSSGILVSIAVLAVPRLRRRLDAST
jgi:hypothetical protein